MLTSQTGPWSLIVIPVSLCFLLAASTGNTREGKGTLVTGTGEFVTEVTRTTESLDPTCVSLVTRVGSVAFSGFIENAIENGRQEVRGLRDGCVDPVQGTATSTYTLDEATVAGRTGGLIIEATGVFSGDAMVGGARPRYHFAIRGVSGDLKGARGAGQTVGHATDTDAFNTYYVEIRLPPGR